VFPGCKLGLTLEDLRAMLAKYDGVDTGRLRANLARFLQAVVPVAEEAGVRLAIHPDDPPFPILGLSRIVSTAADVEEIFSMTDSPANGLCFCTGSFSIRAENDLPAMARKFGPRIHAVHLRSTKREADGSFYEADHLGGSVDMHAVVRVLLEEQDRRHREGRGDCRLPFRPDHGHRMMDDLAKPPAANPGYDAIGRMRGLAELRGLQVAIRREMGS
jgi:mannonate dehydratase